jgi:hypothetical protein
MNREEKTEIDKTLKKAGKVLIVQVIVILITLIWYINKQL